MQGKGIIKFFLVVVALMCFIQYFYLYPTYSVEKDAEKHATEKSKGEQSEQKQKEVYNIAVAAYLDSMGSEQVFKLPLLPGFTYDELKQKQLALGLDLKGGMSVVLQVDLREFIYNIANNSKDPTLIKALENATAAQTGAKENYIALFAREFKKVAAKNAETSGKTTEKLAHKFFSKNQDINFDTSDDKVEAVLRQKANETVSLTYTRLKDRIDEIGVVQPNVNLDAARDLILVELPGIRNPERARKFLAEAAKLEFWNVYRVSDTTPRGNLIDIILQADAKLKRTTTDSNTEEETIETPSFTVDTTYLSDALGNDSLDALGNKVIASIDSLPGGDLNDPLADSGPLLKLLTLNLQGGLGPAIIGTAPGNKINAINTFLEREDIKSMFPPDISFKWGNKPMTFDDESQIADLFTKDTYQLYAIKKDRGKDTAPLEGDRVVDASANPNPQNGEIEVILAMDGKGAKKWGEMTTACSNDQGREIAIVLDNKVVSAPRVNEPILQGRSSITGGFTATEAEDLAKMLQVGKLPADIEIIQESLVGPSLGKDNIRNSLSALMIGFSLVFLFMILYYGSGGLISILALFLNIFFIGGTLASLGTVLTLPGIAGIVLTIGMAVDANVIIYERIREELREGKTLLMSIRDGFQHSYSAIIDANVTTILVAGVLAYFGLGPIKGFAVVLIIGVISSLFTAVLVGRLMIDWWTVTKGNNLTFWTGFSKNAFTNLSFDWLGKRKIAYGFSIFVIALGIGSMAMRGFELGVDFKGGYSYNVQIDQGIKTTDDEIRTALATSFEGASTVVKAVSTGNAYNVTTSYLIKEKPAKADSLVMVQLHQGIQAALGGKVDYENFKNPDGVGTYVNNSSKVGPTIADDIKDSSVWATIFALLLIFGYIFIRFNKWQYSMGAVAALFHDVLFVLSIFSLFHGIFPFSMEIDQAFIAAILTVIGYSINDTVVVFDRVREFMNDYTKLSKTDVINKAINSTVSRTVITSLTTLFVILILFIFGGGSIKGFAFALLIGVIVGTYSSVFIATPVMSDLSEEIKPKESKKKSFSKAASA